jgi:hypothetical protein
MCANGRSVPKLETVPAPRSATILHVTVESANSLLVMLLKIVEAQNH